MTMVLRRQAGSQALSPMPVAGFGSLLFNMEVEDTANTTSNCQKRVEELASRERLQALLHSQQPCHFLELLGQDVRAFKRSIEREDGRCDCVSLAAKLSAVGYAVKVRQGASVGVSNVPGACFRNLQHTCLQIRCHQAGSEYVGMDFLVEPAFREQFQVSHPTPHYAALLEAVPEEFVGTNARLVPLVHFLCAEMAASFVQQGLTLPPWRKAHAMLSKWMPVRSRDIDISSASSSTLAGASPQGTSPPSGATALPSSPEGGSPGASSRVQQHYWQLPNPSTTINWLEAAKAQREQAALEEQVALQLANLAVHNERTASPVTSKSMASSVGFSLDEVPMLRPHTTLTHLPRASSNGVVSGVQGGTHTHTFTRHSEPAPSVRPGGTSPRGSRSLLSQQLAPKLAHTSQTPPLALQPQPSQSQLDGAQRVHMTVLPGQPPIHKVRLQQ